MTKLEAPEREALEAEETNTEPETDTKETETTEPAKAEKDADIKAEPEKDKKPDGESDRRNKRTILMVVIIAAAVVAVLAGALIWALTRQGEDLNDDDFFDPLAETGLLPDMTEEQIREELNRVVQEGAMNISIAGRIIFEDGTSEGRANIVNSEANHYIQKVTMTLDDTGEEIYASGGIRPGQYIQYITLEQDLEPGTYEATAIFTGYTEEERQVVGSVAAKLEIIVKA